MNRVGSSRIFYRIHYYLLWAFASLSLAIDLRSNNNNNNIFIRLKRTIITRYVNVVVLEKILLPVVLKSGHY